jgi:hypothetical protein
MAWTTALLRVPVRVRKSALARGEARGGTGAVVC